jgi:phosphate transport system substrate-binding protein
MHAVILVAIVLATALRETGSTLLYPLVELWAQAYERAHTDVTIAAAGTGSGAGIAQAIGGDVDIGASDAYLSDDELKSGSVLNVPLAVSAVVVAYDLQQIGDRHLQLSGDVLAGIYDGSILYWDDARIRALNPEIGADLPHARVIPVRREEASGDTFLFTEYLARTSKGWHAGFGTEVKWPKVDAMEAARGNAGMIEKCGGMNGTIAYVAVSYVPQMSFGDLGYAALRSHDGEYVLPTPESMGAAVAQSHLDAEGRASLVDRSGANAYPIVSYEYAIVRKSQPDIVHADALKNFLAWAVAASGGNDEARFLSALDFVPLPDAARATSERLIAEIR